ncbi:MAG: anti-sigma factor domain-containing protein [Gaiellaceae bacterium]
MPALLDLAGSVEAEVERPPPALEHGVVEGYADHREGRGLQSATLERAIWLRRRRAWLVSAALGALVGAAATALTIGSSARLGDREVVLGSSSGASARVVLSDDREGTVVRLQAHGLAPTRETEVYELWFVSPQGRVSAGTCRVPSPREVDARLTSAASHTGYTRLGVTRRARRK